MYFRLDMKSVYAETLYNLNVSSEQAEFLCNPNVRVDVFYRNTSILLIDTKRCITYICDTRCTLVGTTFMTS